EFPDQEIGRAEALAQKALALDPAMTHAYRVLAHISIFRRDYDRALAEIDRALASNPSDADNFMVRGITLLWSGKPADSVPWLEAELRLNAANTRASLNLAIAKYLLGRYDWATDVM